MMCPRDGATVGLACRRPAAAGGAAGGATGGADGGADGRAGSLDTQE